MSENYLKQIMEDCDHKYGNFPDTNNEQYKRKRVLRLDNMNKKTRTVIQKLQVWGLPFTLCEILHSKKQKQRLVTDIFIPYANIAIRQVDVDDKTDASKAQYYYQLFKTAYYPFFVRSNESIDFIIDKLQKCLINANNRPKKGFKSIKHPMEQINNENINPKNNKKNVLRSVNKNNKGRQKRK